MSFESAPQESKEEKNGNEILKQNVNSLIELFQLNENTGKYDSNDKNVVEIGRLIQKHTESVNGGYNRISDPEAFLSDIRTARDRAIEIAGDDEKEKIREIFNHVDMP